MWVGGGGRNTQIFDKSFGEREREKKMVKKEKNGKILLQLMVACVQNLRRIFKNFWNVY